LSRCPTRYQRHHSCLCATRGLMRFDHAAPHAQLIKRSPAWLRRPGQPKTRAL
jgi:hypothetical protein